MDLKPAVLRMGKGQRRAGGLRKPLRGGRLLRESPLGAVINVYSKSSSICFSTVSCSRMYLRMVSSSNPTVLTQYPLAQKCRPVARLFRRILRWIQTALFPFRNPITNAMLNFGGTLKHMWIWSGIKCPSSNSTPLCRDKSRNISPTRRRNFPYNSFLRYFGTITTWYLQSHRTCDKLVQSCIGSSSSPLKGLSRRKSLFYFSPDR